MYDSTTIPEIRPEGKWLERIGFASGSEIRIQEYRSKSVITLEVEGQDTSY
jgi:toxic protein SymE